MSNLAFIDVNVPLLKEELSFAENYAKEIGVDLNAALAALLRRGVAQAQKERQR